MTGINAHFIFKEFVPWLNSLVRINILIGLLFVLPGSRSFAQPVNESGEIKVFLEAQGFGGKEIDAVVKDGRVFLPVKQMLQFLGISPFSSTEAESITGYFVDEESTFHIDGNKYEIQYRDDLFRLSDADMFKHSSGLFMSTLYFEKIFGLECIYNSKKQSVRVNPQLELPLIRELRQNDLDSNLIRLTSEDVSDAILGRAYTRYAMGMVDWSVRSVQEINGPVEANIDLGIGSIIAGGEFNALLNYNTNEPLAEKQQQYLWRYVDNFNPTVSQISIGKINPLTTATIVDPVIGIHFTNRPTTLRRSSGTYTFSDHTEPYRIVELYVNNILVEYTMADADGFFTFEIPLSYGNSPIRLKFYGLRGEERAEERSISLPYYFVPVKTLEYDLAAGFVQDTLNTRFIRMDVNYGITQNVTIGAGYERLSTFLISPLMPFAKGSIRLAPDLILTGELTYKVRWKGNLIYKLPSNIQLDLNYTKFNSEQEALDHNYLERRSASVLLPLRFSNFSSYNRISFNQHVLPTMNSTSAEWLFSGSFYGVNTNFTTAGLFIGDSNPTIYSKLALSYRFNSGLRISPMVQYGYTDNQLLSFRVSLEKKLIKRAYLHLSYYQDLKRDLQRAELGFRYNFDFAQTGIAGIRTENSTFLAQHARGSFIFDRSTGYLDADRGSNVGEGGLTIIPFIDANENGRRDSGEPKVPGLSLRISSGQITRVEKDTTIRIFGLEAYTNQFIEFDDSGFDSHLLNLSNRTYSVIIEPNVLRKIEVPVRIVGEANGMIMISEETDTIGAEGILARIYEVDQRSGVTVGADGALGLTYENVYSLVGEVNSDSTGQYMFRKLATGSYTVRLDSLQLYELGMTSDPTSIEFDILGDIEKASVSGLDFMLQRIPEEEEPDTISEVIPEPVVQITTKDTTYVKVHEVVQEVLTDTSDSWAIQLGAFSRKSNALAFKDKLAGLLDREIEIVIEDGLYKVRILDFDTREKVDEYVEILGENGIKELWVINLKGMRKQMMLMTLTDTINEVVEIRTEMTNPEDRADLNIQLGAFRDSSKAEALRKRFSLSLDQPVIIVEEYGYFKVRVAGFKMPEERESVLPVLKDLGHEDIWVVPYDTAYYESLRESAVEEPEEVEVDSSIIVEEEVIEPEIIEEEVIEEEEITEEEIEPVVEEEVVEEVEEPRFSIQAGVFPDMSDARTAKRRIENRLELPVILVEEFDYVRVIIPGFYNREDTYKYYPMLTGLGYDKIMVIEKR